MAKVGDAEYPSLNAAVEAAEIGDTVVLLRDSRSDCQVDVPDDASLVIDFSGHTYEICDDSASGGGASISGFSVPSSASVSFNNGTIKVADGAARVRGAITSRGDVSFCDMNIVSNSLAAVPLIDFVSGNAVFSGATNLTTPSPDATAFYVRHWGPTAPAKGIHVVFDESYTGEVSGEIFYYSDFTNKAVLEVYGNGRFYSIEMASYTTVEESVSVYGGSFSIPLFPDLLADGFDIVSVSDGSYKVVPADRVRNVLFDYGEDFDYDTNKSEVEVKVEVGSTVGERELHAPSGYRVFWMLPNGAKFDFATPVTEDVVLVVGKSLLPIKVDIEVGLTTLLVGDTTAISAYPHSDASYLSYSYAWYKNGKQMNVASDVSSIVISEGGTYGVIVTAADREGHATTSELVKTEVVYSGMRMYRLYNRYTGEHFYTSSTVECDSLTSVGWNYEGVGWTAPLSGDPVYRLYNPYVSGGDHHYTLSEKERDSLVAVGWRYEGVGWRSAPSKSGVPLYRQYNPFATT